MIIELPISKSIANRLLMCKAMRGDDLSEVVASPAFASYPDDVRLLAEHLHTLQSTLHSALGQRPCILHCQNAGTAARFLTAYCAQLEGCEVRLTGCDRMLERPIGQLVDALRQLGADIAYEGTEGFPPLLIRGKRLQACPVRIDHPQSTQFVSALLLIGAEVQTCMESPYIDLTRSVIYDFRDGFLADLSDVERDWSSAAFWLEREALGLTPEPYTFPGLLEDSQQGDRVARELFACIRDRSITAWDFSSCPDLYPAAAVACHLLGLHPDFTGLESLRLKESDRIAAIEDNLGNILPGRASLDSQQLGERSTLNSYSDHRIAMAFLAAGIPVDDTACISKSYPAFLSQLLRTTRVVALREGSSLAPVGAQLADRESEANKERVGVRGCFADGLITLTQPDESLGKKHALLKAVPSVESEFVWLTDADILPPPMPASLPEADLLILPLRMRSQGRSLVERLQILEYDAIQSLTMLTADWGRPVMCAGANMIVRRSAWEECSADIRPDIPSGDDMFILEAMKRRGKTVVAGDASLTATCMAQPSFAALMRQRMRWAGKAPAYRDSDILACGAITVLSNLLVYVLPGWLLVKWLADMLLVRRIRTARAERLSVLDWLLGLLLAFVYPLYMLVCLVGGLFRRRKW